MKAKRGLIAILLGIVTSIFAFYVIALVSQILTGTRLLQLYTFSSIPTFLTSLLLLLITIAIGGFVASIITRARGWIYGAANGAILWLLLFILGILTGDFLTQFQTGGTIQKSITPAGGFVRMEYYLLLLRWKDVVALCSSFIIAGMLGGILGELLAQKWHKRAQGKH